MSWQLRPWRAAPLRRPCPVAPPVRRLPARLRRLHAARARGRSRRRVTRAWCTGQATPRTTRPRRVGAVHLVVGAPVVPQSHRRVCVPKRPPLCVHPPSRPCLARPAAHRQHLHSGRAVCVQAGGARGGCWAAAGVCLWYGRGDPAGTSDSRGPWPALLLLPPNPSSQPRRPRPPPRRSPRLKRRCRACVWAECAVWRCWASCLSCRTHATAPSALLRLSSEAAAAHGPARVAGLGAGCGSGAGGAALRPGLPPGSAPGARHRAATRRRLARRRYRFGPQPAEFDGQRALSAPAALPCPAAAAAAAAAPLPCSRLHCANGHLSAHSPNSSTATQLPPQTLYWTIKPSPHQPHPAAGHQASRDQETIGSRGAARARQIAWRQQRCPCRCSVAPRACASCALPVLVARRACETRAKQSIGLHGRAVGCVCGCSVVTSTAPPPQLSRKLARATRRSLNYMVP